ncbi:RND multidrug efflux transporter, Acriflavin resistance protein [Klebsiella pneumoniae]|uniref:RND multidrug efflux transporter, Acriflavin resistance protein n=1 Tax=Klebsiella pneumoniae TaxID=573 RepID=A0A2X3H242_KLEPN|nr:RND multidrug efflux transporter, Acriflavin resistance protein [Klebsiella pneumoniae]
MPGGGISWQEQQTGNQAVWIVLAAVAMAWLFLVAQYESWTLPASVMLSVLFAIGGALLWLWDRGLCQRCVCSDRAGAADRPGGEECDSDR